MLSVFRGGNEDNAQMIISLVRAGAPIEEVQALVEQLVSGPPWNASQRDNDHEDPANDHMSFYQP